jgi:hypothetical protein
MAISEIDRLTRHALPSGDDWFKQSYNHTPRVPKHEWLGKTTKWLRKTGGGIVSGLRVATVPALQTAKATISDHILTIAAITCFDWAAFLWNDKAGLITTGIAFILFELKVSQS